MKKLCKVMFLFMAFTIFNCKVNALSVASVAGNNYSTITEAVTAAKSGDTIKLLANSSVKDMTLTSGVTLDIPSGITLNLSGNVIVQNGTIVKNNGIIVVDNGVLDISKLSYSNNGLVPNQTGTISIKNTGRVIMLDAWANVKNQTWPDGWKPTIDSHILTNCEDGASIVSGTNTFVYKNNAWQGAITIGETSYETLEAALTGANANDTIKLLANINVPANTIKINKSITIDLNGFNITAINRVLTIQNAKVTITGTGSIIETTPDYGPIVLKGSNNSSDTNYTVLTVDKNVILKGWAGIFVTPYLPSGSPYAYGVVANINGTINGVNDSSGARGIGVYINGQIQDKVNAPIININSKAKITSSGTGIYAAGFANWTIDGVTITGVESGLGIKAGKFNIKNSNITSTGNDYTPVEVNGNDINPSGAALQIESNASYAGNVEINLNNNTIISEKGYAIYEYGNKSTSNLVSLTINNGTFKSSTTRNVFAFSDKFTLIKFITGGTYTTDPSSYVVDGYKVFNENGVYTVSKENIPTGTRTVSGVITNGVNATVQLKQGGVVVKTVMASNNGSYNISNITNGVYNLVVTLNSITTTKTVEVKDKNVILNFNMPVVSSKLETLGNGTPNIIANGLDSIINNKDVTLTVQKVVSSKTNNAQTSISNTAETKDLTFFDFTMYVDGNLASESGVQFNPIEIIVPYNLDKKNDVVIYRYHNEKTEKFTKLSVLPTSNYVDGTYYLDTTNNLIHIYTNKFSTYAIGTNNITNPATADSILFDVALGLIAISTLTFVCIKKRKIIK